MKRHLRPPTFLSPVLRRGGATVMALLMLLVLMTAGMGLANGVIQANHLARVQQSSSQAFNLAESGAERALFYLRNLTSAPSTTAPFNPFGGSVAMGDGTYNVTIDGQDNNASIHQRIFLITSVGTVRNRQETVQMRVRASTFGLYGTLFDKWVSGLLIGEDNRFYGPFHTNGAGNTKMVVGWSTTATQPIFYGPVTSVPTSITWHHPRAPQNEAEFLKIFKDGSAGYRLGVANVPLPSNTNVQRDKAWGSSTGFPTTDGVYVPAVGSTSSGGIYLRGDVTSMVFSVPAANQQRMTMVIGTKTWEVTVDRSANTTVLKQTAGTGSPSTTTRIGTTNGSIYCTGNVNSLSGTLGDSRMSGSTLVERNAFTLTTDVFNSKNVVVTGNLKYQTAPNTSENWDSTTNLKAAALGIVTNELQIGSTAPTNLDIHAAVLAGGAGRAGKFHAPTAGTKSPRGTVRLLGGCVANEPGWTYTSSTGWVDTYEYDTRMANNPPPYFPLDGLYDRLSWKRTSASFTSY